MKENIPFQEKTVDIGFTSHSNGVTLGANQLVFSTAGTYNIRDVEIIVELEKSLKFIELTVTICHLCHTPYETIYYSTVLNDGAILTYLKRKGIVSPNKPTTYNQTKLLGSYRR